MEIPAFKNTYTAKVSTIKFEINKTPYSVNVNCNYAGQFKAYLPEIVAEALRIRPELSANTISSLEKIFNEAFEKYKNAHTTEDLFIMIAYYARGFYTKRKDGSLLFGGHGHKYTLDVNFSTPNNAIGLDFMVAIKQTIDGKEKWFKAKLGKELATFQEGYSQPDIYHKQETIHDPKKYKAIPFSETALQSLQNAGEKIRAASELLFDFIEQDEKQILLTLTNQKLLQ